MRRWSQATQRWAIVALLCLLVLAGWAGRGKGTSGDWLELRCAGSSSRPFSATEWIPFALTNHSRHRLVCSANPEAKTPGGWRPEAGKPPENLRRFLILPPGAGCTFWQMAPNADDRWRVAVNYHRVLTRWEQRRLVWAVYCSRHHLRWLGRWIAPQQQQQQPRQVVSEEYGPPK